MARMDVYMYLGMGKYCGHYTDHWWLYVCLQAKCPQCTCRGSRGAKSLETMRCTFTTGVSVSRYAQLKGVWHSYSKVCACAPTYTQPGSSHDWLKTACTSSGCKTVMRSGRYLALALGTGPSPSRPLAVNLNTRAPPGQHVEQVWLTGPAPPMSGEVWAPHLICSLRERSSLLSPRARCIYFTFLKAEQMLTKGKLFLSVFMATWNMTKHWFSLLLCL